MVSPLFHKTVIGSTPPLILTEAAPPSSQEIAEYVKAIVSKSGSIITKLSEAIHQFTSVTVHT